MLIVHHRLDFFCYWIQLELIHSTALSQRQCDNSSSIIGSLSITHDPFDSPSTSLCVCVGIHNSVYSTVMHIANIFSTFRFAFRINHPAFTASVRWSVEHRASIQRVAMNRTRYSLKIIEFNHFIGDGDVPNSLRLAKLCKRQSPICKINCNQFSFSFRFSAFVSLERDCCGCFNCCHRA